MTFDEAMALQEPVRRATWPVRFVAKGTRFPGGDGEAVYVAPEDYTRVWRVWFVAWDSWMQPKAKYIMAGEFMPRKRGGFVKGWGGQIGADYAEVVDGLGTDGGGYNPSEDDRAATDWERLA